MIFNSLPDPRIFVIRHRKAIGRRCAATGHSGSHRRPVGGGTAGRPDLYFRFPHRTVPLLRKGYSSKSKRDSGRRDIAVQRLCRLTARFPVCCRRCLIEMKIDRARSRWATLTEFLAIAVTPSSHRYDAGVAHSRPAAAFYPGYEPLWPVPNQPSPLR